MYFCVWAFSWKCCTASRSSGTFLSRLLRVVTYGTLAHAHGTLISVVNIVFGLSVPYIRSNAEPSRWVSRCFKSAGSLLPLGFFLGGVRFYSGDPGLGIALVPIGGAALLYATIQTVHSVWKRQPSEDDPKA